MTYFLLKKKVGKENFTKLTSFEKKVGKENFMNFTSFEKESKQRKFRETYFF